MGAHRGDRSERPARAAHGGGADPRRLGLSTHLGHAFCQRVGRLRGEGADVRYGDFAKPETLAVAFAGGSRALVISVLGANAAERHRAAFDAAAAAGVQHVVYTSVLNPVPENPFPPAEWQRRSEEALRTTGVPWTILRNALYADLRADIAVRYLEEGQWTTNIGGGAHAFVTRANCAAAASGVLTGEGHEGRTYDVTGPELINAATYHDLLQEFGKRPVELRNVDEEEYERYRRRFMANPRDATFFELFTGTGRAIREGFLDQISPGVRELTGHEPTRLRDLLAASVASPVNSNGVPRAASAPARGTRR